MSTSSEDYERFFLIWGLFFFVGLVSTAILGHFFGKTDPNEGDWTFIPMIVGAFVGLAFAVSDIGGGSDGLG